MGGIVLRWGVFGPSGNLTTDSSIEKFLLGAMVLHELEVPKLATCRRRRCSLSSNVSNLLLHGLESCNLKISLVMQSKDECSGYIADEIPVLCLPSPACDPTHRAMYFE